MGFDKPVDLDSIPPADKLVLPVNDIVLELQKITEEFGKRKVPDDIPQEYRTIIEGIKAGQRDVLTSCADAVQMSDALIDQIVHRVRQHNTYMAREKKIASKLTEKYKNLWRDIESELAAEEVALIGTLEGAGA